MFRLTQPKSKNFFLVYYSKLPKISQTYSSIQILPVIFRTVSTTKLKIGWVLYEFCTTLQIAQINICRFGRYADYFIPNSLVMLHGAESKIIDEK